MTISSQTGLDGGAPGRANYRGLDHAEIIEDYRLACISRALDERQLILHKQGKSFFHIAGAGHEALLIGLAHALRPGYDWFFPYYRDLPLALALGMTPEAVLLHSVGADSDPNSGGRQMPSHWSDVQKHIVTGSSPTGSQCLPALGSAESTRYIVDHHLDPNAHADEITYVSLGEGATSEGEFWEGLNTACRHRLPILYLVADNGYAISVPASEQAPAPISDLVRGFSDLSVYKVDGCDYFASRSVGAEAVARMRAGGGPALIHGTVTRPFSHSSSDNQAKYRTAHDLAAENERDPIIHWRDELIKGQVFDEDEAEAIRVEAYELVMAVSNQVLLAPAPATTSIREHLFALPSIPPERKPEPSPEDTPIFFGEAIRLALHEAMANDERVRVFGEDVADAPAAVLEEVDGIGGVFGTTAGLQRSFGADRCFNTPLAEANIVGRAIGQAVRGLRPIPEIQFFDYIWPAMHQIRSEAATTRWRSKGAWHVPMILRTAIGGYLTGGAIWHSQCGESIFTHIPGLIVMFPSRARDVVGLMRTALQCEDPVLFLEHKHLFRQRHAMDPFPPADYQIPLGCADTVRPGRDLTLVTWGATVQRSKLAAEELAKEGVEVEILDLRTLAPWDKDAVAASVKRTSRLLVVHEDIVTSGFGAEVAAFAAQECFSDLDAPVRRVGAVDTWVGYNPVLERATLPQVPDIAAAIREVVSF
jgi:2-oxoisovalerate dehydrogenase E1 component